MQAAPSGAGSVRRWGPSIGLLLPQEEGPGDPVPRWSVIRQAAQVAEAMGLDAVWVVDHLVWGQDPWGRPAGRAGRAPARPS
ncbi:MAG TPA: hypothetical protein VFW92_04770, partial [Candidatus Limnocylindrales bacterium]|nr:hypothetical protein [Candidatus Limnocylindrales bacterium]